MVGSVTTKQSITGTHLGFKGASLVGNGSVKRNATADLHRSSLIGAKSDAKQILSASGRINLKGGELSGSAGVKQTTQGYINYRHAELVSSGTQISNTSGYVNYRAAELISSLISRQAASGALRGAHGELVTVAKTVAHATGYINLAHAEFSAIAGVRVWIDGMLQYDGAQLEGDTGIRLAASGILATRNAMAGAAYTTQIANGLINLKGTELSANGDNSFNSAARLNKKSSELQTGVSTTIMGAAGQGISTRAVLGAWVGTQTTSTALLSRLAALRSDTQLRSISAGGLTRGSAKLQGILRSKPLVYGQLNDVEWTYKPWKQAMILGSMSSPGRLTSTMQ